MDKRKLKLDDIVEFQEYYCYGNPKWFRQYDTCKYEDKENIIDCGYKQKGFCYNTQQTKTQFTKIEENPYGF